ncbi:MAG: hypothetical protein LQ350_008065 [Teloschistes chrysophthalmus]|nr:MAG: hypothetical protein LQ350_008065 [Niorma chrysophthalma]
MDQNTTTRIRATDENTIDVNHWVVRLGNFIKPTRRAWPELVTFVDTGEVYWRQLCEDIVQTIEDPTIMDPSYWVLYLEPLSEILELNSAGGFARVVNEPDPEDGSDSDNGDYSEDSVESDDGSDSDDADDADDSEDDVEPDVDHSYNWEIPDDDSDDDSDSSSNSTHTNRSTGMNHESRTFLQHIIFTLPRRLPPNRQSAYKSLITWSRTWKTKYYSCPLHKNTDVLAGARLDGFLRRVNASQEALFRRITGRQLGDVICVDVSVGRTAEALKEAEQTTAYVRSFRLRNAVDRDFDSPSSGTVSISKRPRLRLHIPSSSFSPPSPHPEPVPSRTSNNLILYPLSADSVTGTPTDRTSQQPRTQHTRHDLPPNYCSQSPDLAGAQLDVNTEEKKEEEEAFAPNDTASSTLPSL